MNRPSPCPGTVPEEGVMTIDSAGFSMALGAALPATFTFLYQRLNVLLSRHGADAVDPEDAAEIPEVLVSDVRLPLRADPDELESRQAELRAYALGLAQYHHDPSRVTSEDTLLMQTLGDLRTALEAIYEQRFTFQGEQGAQSGPLNVQQHGTVAGEVIGMEATNSIRGEVTNKITTKRVERGARVVGMSAQDIEGSR